MRRTLAALALALLAACDAGIGSDIGPKIEHAVQVDYRVLVRDDQGRAVCNAKVTIAGLDVVGVSGRSGRAALPARPGGTRVITVDTSAASATHGDRLVGLSVAAQMPDGDELPYTLFVPDTAPSASLTLATGTLASTQTLDDSASSGALVTLPNGTTLGDGGASAVTLRTGLLSAGHLPPVPEPGSGPRMLGRGVAIAPASVTFGPSATLSLPNDLRLGPGAPASLFRLDAASGAWIETGTGQTSGDGLRIVATSGVTNGGVHAFGTIASGGTTTILGRVYQVRGLVQGGVLVCAGERKTRTRPDGRFALEDLATLDATGLARTVTVELFGGRDLRANRLTRVVPLVAGTIDLGDITFETVRTGTLRLLLVREGQRDASRRVRSSSLEGLTYGIGIGDAQGLCTLEDQEVGVNTMITTRVKDERHVWLTEGGQDMRSNQLGVDLRLFAREIDWWLGRGKGTVTYAVDQDGSGLIFGASVLRGQVPGAGFVQFTSRNGFVNADYGFVGEATVAHVSGADGRTVWCASSFVDPDSGRIEVPVERAVRQPTGAFDRHGLVDGNLSGGASGAKTRRVRATRRLALEDWFDETFLARSVAGDLPKKLDPETTGATAFTIGVPAPQGHLSALEGTTNAGKLTLERLGWLAALTPALGTRIAADVALGVVCDTPYAIGGLLENLHATLSAADFAFDLGAELASGEIVDLARGVAGNHAPLGAGALLQLPTRGSAGVTRFLLAWKGERTTSGRTIAQKVFVPVIATSGQSVRLHPVPEILSPAPGAVVPSAGFTVQFTVPPGTVYTQIALRSVTSAETRVWNAVVHPDYTSYTFRKLPDNSAQVLAAGRTWTLTVTAARLETGPLALASDAYRRVLTHWVGISEAEREINALSSSQITVTTN